MLYAYVIYIHYIYIYTYIYPHIRVSPLTSREQLMSPECSKHQVLSFAKMLIYIYIYIYIYI